MKSSDFLGGVLVGVVVGAVVGLLLAPQSGEETREMISKQAGELTDKVKEGSRQLVESSRDLYEQGKTQVTSAVQRGREAAESLRHGAEGAKGEA
ncbi:MAG: YtxH domain-containing protein [Armatimonadota bacterium]